GASTILGSRIVKLDPWPGSLSTVMSPPIMRQKCRLMADRARYRRICSRLRRGSLGKLLKQLAHLLGRHADARDRNPFAAVLRSLVSGDGNGALLGKLVRVAR